MSNEYNTSEDRFHTIIKQLSTEAMNTSDCVNQPSNEIIDILSDDYSYLDSDDSWLSYDPNKTINQNNSNEDIKVWIKEAFGNEKSRGTNMALLNKLDELKLMSPSIDSRTFTRKRNLQKRQSIFNGGLSSLCSPVNEDEYSSPETNDKTFEVQTTKKSMNGTFKIAQTDSTFTLSNDDDDIQLNNIDDVEKIAKKQEDSLRQSCSNGWSPPSERSPTRNQMITNRMNATINSNTLTKSRDPNRYARLESELNSYQMNGNEDQYYENGLSPEESFQQNVSYTTSTPLVPKYRNMNLTQEMRETIGPKIMPDVSNLRANSSHTRSKIGRSEPNLSQRLQPMAKGLGYNSTKASHLMTNRTLGNPLSNNFLQAKVASDSRLLVKNGLKFPQNQTQTIGRVTSPPPSQSQQLLNRKVAVEGELNRMGTTTANSTNLCRKSTFRVRDYPNSEENLKENGCGPCFTNSSASTNGYKTNKTNNNNVQTLSKMSKIPGPKPTIRSGIPVSGQRTAIPCPTNFRPANPTDNWSNGCY